MRQATTPRRPPVAGFFICRATEAHNNSVKQLQNKIDFRQRDLVQQVDLEIGLAVAIGVTLDDGVTALLDIVQLTLDVMKAGVPDERKRLIAAGHTTSASVRRGPGSRTAYADSAPFRLIWIDETLDIAWLFF